jgi:hypothetical protein
MVAFTITMMALVPLSFNGKAGSGAQQLGSTTQIALSSAQAAPGNTWIRA